MHTLSPDRSLYRGVRRVAPPLPEVRREPTPADAATPHDAPAQTLVSACADVVSTRVTAGAFDVSLSGGVDSAVLCALAARQAPGRVRAWSMDVHFADETERRNARMVARATGVELVDVPIPDAVLPDLFEPTVIATETPILNARVIASFAFYAAARLLGASTMLSGAGADEVLLGNPNAMASAAARIEEDRRLARTVLRAPVDNLGNTQAMPWSLGGEEATEEVRYAAWVLRELVLPPNGAARAPTSSPSTRPTSTRASRTWRSRCRSPRSLARGWASGCSATACGASSRMRCGSRARRPGMGTPRSPVR